jgi:hypothetical protein
MKFSNSRMMPGWFLRRRDAVGVVAFEHGHLGHGHRGCRVAAASQSAATAVAGLAPPPAGPVEGAAGATPYVLRADHRRVEAPAGPWVELGAAAAALVEHERDRRPHRERAPVGDGERRRASPCSKGGGDDEEEEDRLSLSKVLIRVGCACVRS